ncbi:4-hydroxy-3-methylbut-2-enyl diphosphate reductase [Actinomadura alba]|uniref:4-hydroxy-3-methylbut-2-enyl diphosphate reductase n=1 Tax=Actinomadura alba TaxID=406431 RepID=A0ABR7M053_9ACTN|nr:4-hydroxy-3-methylbut-2-enyl diphosphate reductase [Actinomadura alba]MBC6470174.1 4-hydroxy-3-methylbut-2-enyl diphosphate reductase [Actinomadura alba]
MTRLLICTALGIEARALRRGLPGDPAEVTLIRTGMGPVRARRAGALLPGFGALAVAGVGGALDEDLRPGEVLVASEVRFGGRVVPCPSAALLAGELVRAGMRAQIGPLVTSDHVVTGAERRRLSAAGARAVDMEAGPLAGAAAGRPFAAVRVIVDTPNHAMLGPHTLTGGLAARRTLARVGPVLVRWAAAAGPRRVLLAAPRSFCAGVDRAIEIVVRALERHGPPVYVRKQIVHNRHVVEELEQQGAIFVEELTEVPAGAVTIFSAHGVGPAVREDAARRGLQVIDATCPLVAKVHAEARRFAARGDLVVLIGHAGHEEVEGTLGEIPGRGVLVENVDDVATLPGDRRIAYLMQTTLAADEAGHIAAAIRRRFPDAEGPRTDDICYATTNRQRAVQAVAGGADLVLVVGSANSSNSRRLAEVAAREGTVAHLIDGPSDIALDWLAGARTVGLTAGASAPPWLVDAVVAELRGLGPVTIEENPVAEETISFTLPLRVRS